MNKITQTIIDELSERQGDSRLTIYMPTHKISTPPTIQEDQTRYKNLIREAQKQWSQQVDESELKDVFDQLTSNYDNEEFWQATSRGLAIFADKSGVNIYKLPIECEERVVVGESFDLTPLHVACGYDQEYYVLALAMQNPKLYKGDAYGLEEVDINLPTSLEEALNIDELHANSQTQRAFTGAPGLNSGNTMHGNGDSSEAGREERLQYFRIIDTMMSDDKYVDTNLPVIIAATESEAGDYRAHSKSQKLLDGFISGNYTKVEAHELHNHAWKMIQDEIHTPKVAELIEKFNETKGVQKASSDIDDIRQAAEAGRVDSLLVCIVENTRDSVDDDTDVQAPLIRFSDKYEQEGLRELVQNVAKQGGAIIGVEQEVFNTPSMVGAIYRY